MNVLQVGMALDTNGQHRRFVEAARRWGNDPAVLKALVAGEEDLAGVAGRWVHAAEKVGGLSIRSAHVAHYAYFQYPEDIRWDRSTHAEVQRLADEADVVHLTNSPRAYTKLKLARTRKPAVLHHHGTLLRNFPEKVVPVGRRYGMVQAVSTIDLLRSAPDLHWLPTAYDLDALAAIGEEHRREPDGVIRIVSAPTNREIKSTSALEAAVATLQAEGLPVELVLIEGKTWAECLRLKATADIYFDQVGLGYGCNAIEAWGMGIPVVAGADEWTLARMRHEWNLKPKDKLPFLEATLVTIAVALRELATNPARRAEYAALGLAHAQRFHAERPALARLAELYAMAIARQDPNAEPVEEFPLRSGTFETTAKPSLVVAIGNQHIRFREGRVTIEDPRMAQRLRRMASFRPRFQISEVEEVA